MTADSHVTRGTIAVSLVELTVIWDEGRGKQLASHEPPMPIQLISVRNDRGGEKNVLKRVFTNGRDTEYSGLQTSRLH